MLISRFAMSYPSTAMFKNNPYKHRPAEKVLSNFRYPFVFLAFARIIAALQKIGLIGSARIRIMAGIPPILAD
jgi:hypothetical protein